MAISELKGRRCDVCFRTWDLSSDFSREDIQERQELEAEAALKRTQDLISSNKLLVTCVSCGTQFYKGGKCVCYPH